jgi:uncharacterized protein YukE
LTTYAGLGFDPTPGDVGAVENALTQLADGGGRMEMLMTSIESDLDLSQGWAGAAADEFHDNLDDIPRALETGAQSMGHVAAALITWAGQLADNKRQTEILDRMALELEQQLSRAAADLNRAKTFLAQARGADRAAAQAEFDRAAVHAVSVNEQFDAVLEQARTLRDKHLAQAEATAAKIAGASDGDTFEPTGKLDQVVGTVGGVLSEVSVWTGRAAFVATLLATGPAGWTAASVVLAGTTAASGLAGTVAQAHAKQAGVYSLKDTSMLGLAADGVLSVGGPAGAGTRQVLKALRANGPKGVLDLAKTLGSSQPYREGLREAFKASNAGKVVQVFRDAGEARTVGKAVENIGKARVEEMARRDAIDKALEGAGHAGSSAVDLADLLDKGAKGDGAPDWLGIPAALPNLPGVAEQAAGYITKEELKKVEGTG